MRLAAFLCLLPVAAQAGANPEALYRTIITGTWAESQTACTSEDTWVFREGGLTIHGDGGETCGFDRPGTDGGFDVTLDVLCPIPGEEMQASARRIELDLDSQNPGIPDPDDRLSVTDKGQTTTLERCPATK